MYEVSLDWEQEQFIWKSLSRWVEFVMGEQEVDWTFRYEGDDIVYAFETETHAKIFEKIWKRRVMSLPFVMWKEFCISDTERAKVERYWARKPWTPETVLLNYNDVKSSIVKGHRRKYSRDFRTWFFEKDMDAVLFYMEHHNG